MDKNEQVSQAFDLVYGQLPVINEDNIDPLARAAVHSAIENVFASMVNHITVLKSKSYKLMASGVPYSDILDVIRDHHRRVSHELVDSFDRFGTTGAGIDNFMQLDSNFASLSHEATNRDGQIDFTSEPRAITCTFATESTRASSYNTSNGAKFGPASSIKNFDASSVKEVYCMATGDHVQEMVLHGQKHLARVNLTTQSASLFKHNLPSILNYRKIKSLEFYFTTDGIVFAIERGKCIYKCPIVSRRTYEPITGLNYIYSSKGVASTQEALYFVDEKHIVRKIVVDDLLSSIANNIEYMPRCVELEAVDLCINFKHKCMLLVTDNGQVMLVWYLRLT